MGHHHVEGPTELTGNERFALGRDDLGSRRRVRTKIRREAIIVALIGGLVGVVLGLFGVVGVSAIPQFKALAIPWGSMVVFLVVAGLFGVLAAILLARRAARLNILDAIQNE